jgi:hypothetical protein
MIHLDLWVKLAARRWESYKARAAHAALPHHFPGLVFTDCRFNNEADWVRSEGGSVIHVERVNVAPVGSHKSEEGVRRANLDRLLINDGTIEDLKQDVAYLVKHMHY